MSISQTIGSLKKNMETGIDNVVVEQLKNLDLKLTDGSNLCLNISMLYRARLIKYGNSPIL